MLSIQCLTVFSHHCDMDKERVCAVLGTKREFLRLLYKTLIRPLEDCLKFCPPPLRGGRFPTRSDEASMY